jgi:hypothetical protein
MMNNTRNTYIAIFLCIFSLVACGSDPKAFNVDSIDSFTYRSSPGLTTMEDAISAQIVFDLENQEVSGTISNPVETIFCEFSGTLTDTQVASLTEALSVVTYTVVENQMILEDGGGKFIQLNEDNEAIFYFFASSASSMTSIMDEESTCDLRRDINDIFNEVADVEECGDGIQTLPSEC